MSTTRPTDAAGGPLTGVRIVEIAGLGAGPFCGMMLADMGADVVRVDRPTTADGPGILGRGRRSIAIDLKTDTGCSLLLDLVGRADGLIEAFRPGVAERLGFRTGTLPPGEPEARLRAGHRLGPAWTLEHDGRPRHQLHRPGRRTGHDRARGRPHRCHP